MTKKYNVTGMTCSSCSSAVEKAVGKLDGVAFVSVNLLSNSMTVKFDNNLIDDNKIIKTIINAGYGAEVHDNEPKLKKEEINTAEVEFKEMKTRIIISFVFMIPLMYVAMGHMINLPMPSWLIGTENAVSFAFLQLLLTIPVLMVNKKYYQIGFKTLFHGRPNMDSLIALGSGAAFVYGIFAIFRIGYGLGHNNLEIVNRYSHDLYFESAAMILTLITLGKFLESRSKGKTSEAIKKLMDLSPETATVIRLGLEMEIPIEDVEVGEIIIVKPGQSIPVDGTIIEGSSAVDQAALTGESIPVEKNIGDKVISATINKTGFFKFKADKVGMDTTLAKIIQLVEDANTSKAPIAKLADKISGVFVPIVILIAILSTTVWMLLGYPFEFALSIGIAVLVISCPCALGLATPVAIMVGTGRGAQYGVLFKSAESLEILHNVKTVILDKTGTITEGKPKVTDIITNNNITKEKLLFIAASIEKPSEHPLAEAIIAEAHSMDIDIIEVENFNSISGKGIIASIDKSNYFAGNLRLMEENNIEIFDYHTISDKLADEGKTPLLFADEKEVLGVIAVADVVKATSKKAIDKLKEMDIDLVMLTGDNKKTAEAIRKELNIDRVVAEVLPQDKENEVRSIQATGRKVAMIGDGINDAPALARADVGIAIGAGTDIAIESADVVLMKSDLLDAVTAIRLSKATIKNIKENLFWAFFYNTLGIPIAAGILFIPFGIKLNPMFGAAAMSLSSLFVVGNALRLYKK